MKTKTTVGLLTVIVLAFAFTLPAFAGDEEKTSSGSATVGNAAPTVTNPMLHNVAGTSDLNNTALTVNTEYHVNCTITDSNSLMDILNITWYVFDGSSTTYASSDANATHYTFKYLNSTDTWSEVGPGPSNAHIVTGSCSQPGTKTGTSGTYHLAFKLALTANYTTVTTQWKVNITVYDAAAASGNVQTVMFAVNAYYLLSLTDTTHAWTGLAAGDTNKTLTTPVDGSLDMTVTSNNNFNLQCKGSGDLTSSESNTIPIGNVLIHKDTLASSINMTVTYANCPGNTGLSKSESTATTVTLWLSVPSGTPSGTYTYTLSIQAVAS